MVQIEMFSGEEKLKCGEEVVKLETTYWCM